jgi:hypothetical protein
MELQKRQWFVHWFFISLAVISRFRGDYSSYWTEIRYRDGTNLCHFIRVILVWAPLIVLLNVSACGLVLAALIAAPIYLFGVTSYLAVIFGLIAIVCVGVGVSFVGFLIQLSVSYLKRRAREKRLSKMLAEGDSTEKVEVPEVPKGPTFGAVLWQYAVATKHRFCPNLTFKSQEMSS